MRTQQVEPPANGPSIATSAGSTGPEPRRLRLRDVTERGLTFAAFVILFLGFGAWLGGHFFNVSARLLDVHQNVPILLLALAAMITLVAGQFDLSIASMATLTTFLAVGLRVNQDLPFALVLIICVAVGLLGGLLNGVLVEYLHVNAFIATLGTGGVFLGASQVYSGGTQIFVSETGPRLPDWFTEVGLFTQKCPSWVLVVLSVLALWGVYRAVSGYRPRSWSDTKWWGLCAIVTAVVVVVALVPLEYTKWIEETSYMVVILIAFCVAMWIVLQRTTTGRYLRATGANREAARLAGVRVRREVMRAFLIGGALAGVAGIALASQQGAATPEVASSYLLPAFAAAFLSTVIFSSGQFTVWGTLIGGIFVIWTGQGLIVGDLPPTWLEVVNGVVLVAAVALSTVLRRRRS
jgi:ribose/xylose/arabinose/galactoside ABC-type transport system permease subunit